VTTYEDVRRERSARLSADWDLVDRLRKKALKNLARDRNQRIVRTVMNSAIAGVLVGMMLYCLWSSL
jgi:DNA-binding transcriptional regulator of glucitol operon